MPNNLISTISTPPKNDLFFERLPQNEAKPQAVHEATFRTKRDPKSTEIVEDSF